MNKRRPALGRGLGALIPPSPAPTPAAATAAPAAGPPAPARTLPIEALQPSPQQPRRRFDETRLRELSASIEAQGIIQPIVVTPADTPGHYFIIAGERRWRASQMAGLHDVPVIVRETDEAQRLELALVENLQRADLNPIEEAQAFAQLCDLQGYSHQTLAERVGKDRSTIANALRLLRLPERVQQMVREEQLSMGHARTLLGLEAEGDMIDLARTIVRDGLSVRATERAVRAKSSEAASPRPVDDEHKRRKIIVDELETRLRRRLGVRVRLKAKSDKAGTLEIPYGTLDELDRVLRMLLDDSAAAG
jgi:ParB family chromosome partitioning protein